jgi:hypothetical protein
MSQTLREQPVVHPVFFVEVEFPGLGGPFFGRYTTAPHAGITWNTRTFRQRDHEWGALAAIEVPPSQLGAVDVSGRLRIEGGTLVADAVVRPDMQDAPVRVWEALFDPRGDGYLVEPTLRFAGVVNTVEEVLPHTDRVLGKATLVITHPLDRMKQPADQSALRHEVQQLVSPGDQALRFMRTVDRQLPWGGKDTPRPVPVPINPSGAPGVTGGTIPFGGDLSR